MTQDHTPLGKAVPCIYAITSSTKEKGFTQKGVENLFNCFSFYCCCQLKYARKRHFSIILNVLLAKCYKCSPSFQFIEIVCDSFLTILLISFQFWIPVQLKGLFILIGQQARLGTSETVSNREA